jgi:hypothetical protein
LAAPRIGVPDLVLKLASLFLALRRSSLTRSLTAL